MRPAKFQLKHDILALRCVSLSWPGGAEPAMPRRHALFLRQFAPASASTEPVRAKTLYCAATAMRCISSERFVTPNFEKLRVMCVRTVGKAIDSAFEISLSV